MKPGEESKDLSISERILRLQDEWDEIAGSPADLDLTPEQIEELQRRLTDHRQNRRHYRTWEEVRAELESMARNAAD